MAAYYLYCVRHELSAPVTCDYGTSCCMFHFGCQLPATHYGEMVLEIILLTVGPEARKALAKRRGRHGGAVSSKSCDWGGFTKNPPPPHPAADMDSQYNLVNRRRCEYMLHKSSKKKLKQIMHKSCGKNCSTEFLACRIPPPPPGREVLVGGSKTESPGIFFLWHDLVHPAHHALQNHAVASRN